MKERPIIFSGPMVRAILEGNKTQTRRVLKPLPLHPDAWKVSMFKEPQFPCPYGKPGDRLWVKETFTYTHGGIGVGYRACMTGSAWNAIDRRAITWKPSIHMPRAASRILLQVTNVRVERLQSIGQADAISEGVEKLLPPPKNGLHDFVWKDYSAPNSYFLSPVRSFASLWDCINGKRPGCGWDANPWVWVVEFGRDASAV